ncbi:MAG: RdgB/HAM1 family non-canonical purine NTP pyrophosphatase [Acholeplasmataceae bacterium]
MEKILIATHNQHKIKEFKRMLEGYVPVILTLKDFDDHEEVVEDQDTFSKNALKKAMHFAKKYQLATLSDDSGLCVDALHGRPGIYSARYSGAGDDENNKKVLKEMENQENRHASFVAALVLAYPDGRYHAVEGTVSGEISHTLKGDFGFGYDAIFYYPPISQTFAEIDPRLKNELSHRGQALSKLKEYLDDHFDNK